MRIYRKFAFAVLIAAFVLGMTSCSDDEDSVTIGGNSEMPQNEVGAKYEFGLKLPGSFDYKNGETYSADSKVVAHENGITTVRTSVGFTGSAFLRLDTMLGTYKLSLGEKLVWMEKMRQRYGFTVDTLDKGNQAVTVDIRAKITDQGIAHYVNGTEDLFTLVKYNSNVGDKYEYTASDGVKYTRTVVAKDEKESYEIVFWKIKVMTIEETFDDPLIEKITYLANHQYGLVAATMTMKTGETVGIDITPWATVHDLND